jgi:hypothetical protein
MIQGGQHDDHDQQRDAVINEGSREKGENSMRNSALKNVVQ